jgi:hypothetical protein
MKTRKFGAVSGILLATLIWPVLAPACDDIEDGCLGCRDDELPACLDMFVTNLCSEARPDQYCDEYRVIDDLERLVIMNTGRHMSDTRALMRSSGKYFLRHPPRP